ncbi:MAG TPA: galactokinase, partial [Puia sp.]|nr:galactokinase [Puia sp.]
MENKVRDEFTARFKKVPKIFAAPGRVNLIGEHTDYNNGFVLPGAIDKKIYVAIAANGSNLMRLYACQYDQALTVDLQNLRPLPGWATYVAGMAQQIRERRLDIGGVDVVIGGDIPLGAGMSSSAALCSAFGLALDQLFELELSRLELARMGQQTEHEFAGVNCGIMDEFASLHGKKGHLIRLDCRNLEFEYVPFDYPDHAIVLVNTMVQHSLAATEYNTRRKQCEEGVSILKKRYPEIESLRDLSFSRLSLHKNELPPIIFKRCSFVVSENERVLRSCEYLRQHDLAAFGEMMLEAHAGLSELYEISCTESDFLVSLAKGFPGVKGARQMGGGFGGCTINLVERPALEEFLSHVRPAYESRFNKQPDIYMTA